MNTCAVYIDFDNFWNGILAQVNAFSYNVLPDVLKDSIRDFLKNFATEWYNGVMIKQLASQTEDHFLGLELRSAIYKARYIKAFADFSALPKQNEVFSTTLGSLGIIQFLHNIGIEPFSPFVRSASKRVKDASDRALILEIVEDIFFQKRSLDAIIIISGDADYYPLISFLKEHSNIQIYVCSFKDRISTLYKSNPMINRNVLLIDTFISFKTFSEKIQKIKTGLQLPVAKAEPPDIESLYSEFKENLIKGVKLWNKNHPGKPVTSGLVLTSWCPRWLERGELSEAVDTATFNKFLLKIHNEGLIDLKEQAGRRSYIITLKGDHK